MIIRFAIWDQITGVAGLPAVPEPLSPPKPKRVEPAHTIEHSLNLTKPARQYRVALLGHGRPIKEVL
ncbi:hypothetical protein [Streptomyces sp. NPDC005969]|uniref:hypothetical protein n=1 Tax=Streptomyces sp. NPDC005969 TaxID=3156722 RepID=UPI0033D030C0